MSCCACCIKKKRLSGIFDSMPMYIISWDFINLKKKHFLASSVIFLCVNCKRIHQKSLKCMKFIFFKEIGDSKLVY